MSFQGDGDEEREMERSLSGSTLVFSREDSVDEVKLAASQVSDYDYDTLSDEFLHGIHFSQLRPSTVKTEEDVSRSTTILVREDTTDSKLASQVSDYDYGPLMDEDLRGMRFPQTQTPNYRGETGITPTSHIARDRQTSTSTGEVKSASRAIPAAPSVNPVLETIKAESIDTIPSKKREASNEGQPSPNKKRRTGTASDMAFSPATTAKTDEREPIVIAHSTMYQKCFDHRQICIGVRWEIARLVSIGRIKHWGQIELPWLDSLAGKNAAAAPLAVPFLLKKIPQESTVAKSADNMRDDELYAQAFAKERATQSPWEELDREQEALKISPYGALGDDQLDRWYGGRVEFSAKLKEVKGSKSSKFPYRIELERLELGTSTHFTRRFGSDRILRVKVPKGIWGKGDKTVMQYFQHPFVLNGQVYKSTYAKDQNSSCTVFLFRTDERVEAVDTEHIKILPANRPGDLSLLGFLNWHNPLELNANQALTKWASRFALGLSNSVPGPHLEPENIISIPDEISPYWLQDSKSKPPSYMEMTDGCGFCNKEVLRQIADKQDLTAIPVAIQCRVNGAKGLLLRHPDESENRVSVPKIWLRPSQRKIKCGSASPLDPAKLRIDLLRTAHMRTPSRLSAETIINVASNGVSKNVLIRLLETGLQECVDGLTDWDGPDGVFKLWRNVAQAGNVFAQRMAREAGGEARVRGFHNEDPEEELDDDDDDGNHDAALRERSSAWWADQIAGCPSSLEETVMTLLDSGFTPADCGLLNFKLREVVKTRVKSFVNRYRIEVPMSCTAWIVPDPIPGGCLGPGEIHVKSSRRNLRMPDDSLTDTITTDVLITRHPCKVPSDVQKVRSVAKRELYEYVDVIVINIRDYRHLASMLAGGDYDGDKALVIWMPEIVQSFINADPKYADEPPNFADYFEKDITSVAHFLNKHHASETAKCEALQQYLLMPLLSKKLVGLYSTYHDNAVYSLGYDNETTVLLAYMFCAVLDSSKTGLVVCRDTLAKHKALFERRGPLWKECAEEVERGLNELHLTRPKGKLGAFIMDDILNAAKARESVLTQKMKTVLPEVDIEDVQLASPWRDAVRAADDKHARTGDEERQSDLCLIKTHVEKVYQDWRKRSNGRTESGPRSKGDSSVSPGARFTELSIEKRQDILRKFSRRFASGPPLDELRDITDLEQVKRLKASYAYICARGDPNEKYGDKNRRFAFDIAMRDLCDIKAKAVGLTKTVTSNFYERFTIGKAWASR